jgi:hypothetical protein
VTVKVYAVPLESPVTTIGEDEPVPVMLLGLDVTVKPVIAVPPVSAGAVNVTDACALPPVAVPIVGASGTVTPLGQLPAFFACMACSKVQIPVATPVYAVPLVVGGVLEILPPMYCLLIILESY